MAINIIYYKSPVEYIKIIEENGYIISLDFHKEIGEEIGVESTELLKCVLQLNEYFEGIRKQFSIKYKIKGTIFQETVWNALTTINFGETVSYKDIAKLIRNEKACRAVGNANNKNKIAIIVPCHRVIGSNKKMVGYASGIWRKKWLLDHEFRYK